MDLYKMDTLNIIGIIYFILLLPQWIIALQKRNYQNKKTFMQALLCSVLLGSILSYMLYHFSQQILSLFTQTNGVKQYAIYCLKILLISSSFLGLQLLLPFYFVFHQSYKHTIVLYITKCFITILVSIIGYIVFQTKGLLYAISISDFIFIFICMGSIFYYHHPFLS